MNSFQELTDPFPDFDDNYFKILDWVGRKSVQFSLQRECTVY